MGVRPSGQCRSPSHPPPTRRGSDPAAIGITLARRSPPPAPAPASRHLGVQPLDHAAVEGDRALAGVLRLLEGRDDGAGAPPPRRGRREDLVGDGDLVGVDQGLAVEAAIAALLAFGAEARLVGEAVVDPVEDVDAVGPRGGERRHQPGHHGGASGQEAGAGLLGEIVRAHDEAGRAACRRRAPRSRWPPPAGSRAASRSWPRPGCAPAAPSRRRRRPTATSVSGDETFGTRIASGAAAAAAARSASPQGVSRALMRITSSRRP